MDPFFEVRTPERNFGPAKLASGTFVTPLARRLAGERGIDLSRVNGSGPHGRVVAADVEAAIASGTGRASAAAMASGASPAQVKALYQGIDYEEVPLDGMRKTIAARLTEAKQTIPHFYLTMDVELDALLKLARGGERRRAEERRRSRLQALGQRLRHQGAGARFAARAGGERGVGRRPYPALQAFRRRRRGGARRRPDHAGDPQCRAEIAVGDLQRDEGAWRRAARDKKLKPAEYQGGASAISNLGMYGVREFSAIINPPHATILAVGAAQRRPVETADGGVKFVSQMSVTLSCDHRVVDGALGAELLGAFKQLLEAPVRMLV